MEITSFVLGMLTIVAVIILTVIVVSLVKINFLTRKTELLQQLYATIESDLRQELENANREVWKQFEAADRDVTIVERTIMNQIESINREHLKHEEDLHREIDETKRYIDSRIDKVVLSGTIKEPKRQILNG
jgi:hypothetical protein